jgi:hypothetical protein
MNEPPASTETRAADEAALAFIERWRHSGASERANYALFLAELCDLLGVERPRPATAEAAANPYCFERPVTFDDGEGRRTTGFIDLYRKGAFVLEAKQGAGGDDDDQQRDERRALGLAVAKGRRGTATRGTRAWERAMAAAKEQARRYARALPAEDGWPPFLVVVDVGHAVDLHADFSGLGKGYVPFPDPATFRLTLGELAHAEARERLRLVWTDPHGLDPAKRSARVTRELAERLGALAASLERDGHTPEEVASFLVRCLFSMFAEDAGLLPAGAFTSLLDRYRERLGVLPQALTALWRTMDGGGFDAGLGEVIPQFNGAVFRDATALPLSAAQRDLLAEAARADWKDVEPAIFGTLLERALDPVERHALGAHYTPRAYVERLVVPAVVEPLREEWDAARTAAAAREAAGDESGARGELVRFHRRLCAVRVLDPACGSGNFLYVALEHLKRLEAEVLDELALYPGQATLDMTGGMTVSPGQFLGLEVNPRAATVAEVVLWIGYLQWHLRVRGDARRLDPPILRALKNVRRQDAVLAYDEAAPRRDAEGRTVTRWDGRTMKTHPVTGEPVPDEGARVPVLDYADARPAEWPSAEFVVGNPPFVGNKRMRDALGDGYTEALRRAYPAVPDSADLVVYWWHRAAEAVRAGKAERFGLVTTNSLTQTFNRRVVEGHLGGAPPLALAYAVPDHPWVDSADGAAVRIAMTVGVPGPADGVLVRVAAERPSGDGEVIVETVERRGRINADLTIGADVASVKPLRANAGISGRGMIPHGEGFLVTADEAAALGFGSVSGMERIVRPYRNGKDVTAIPRGVYVLDTFGLTEGELRDRFPAVYQHLLTTVKPHRDMNKRAARRERWWLFAENQPSVRRSLEGLPRYIATPQTAKHRPFLFLGGDVLPDDKLIAIASDDAYVLGVLSSRAHVAWALAAGSRLGVGNDPVYDKSRCFDPFPFPITTPEQEAEVRALGEALDAHRKARQAEHPALTVTELYNALDAYRAGRELTAKERRAFEDGLVAVLADLHDRLDAAVAKAYGWPWPMPDEEAVARLVALNAERRAEEEAGLVRWLRPSFQAPGADAQQGTLGIEAAATQAVESASKPSWPKGLAEQAQAVRGAVAGAGRAVSAEEVARAFTRAPRDGVAAVLDALRALGLVRAVDDGRYAA